MPQARKRFGQHFLEPAWVDKLVRAIEPLPDQTFLEIGPGHGALTRPLGARAAHVVAIEIDRDLVADLRRAQLPCVTVVEADFLEISVEQLRNILTAAGNPHEVRVAANLPYNIASPILFKLLELRADGVPLVDATVMLQREVADRLIARPGSKEYGVLSVLLQHQTDVARAFNLPPGAFRPQPKVQSSVVRLHFHAPSPLPKRMDVFTGLVQSLFTRRRKTTANALKAFPQSERLAPHTVLAEARIDGGRRPETLSIAELVQLADAYS